MAPTTLNMNYAPQLQSRSAERETEFGLGLENVGRLVSRVRPRKPGVWNWPGSPPFSNNPSRNGVDEYL